MADDALTRLNAVLDDARRWHQVRGGINDRKPHRRGGPLRMDTLGNCIAALEEYRGILNRIDTATTVFSHHGEVLAFVESIRDGYPLKVGALNEKLQHVCPDDGVRHAATEARQRGAGQASLMLDEEAQRRGSGWGTE